MSLRNPVKYPVKYYNWQDTDAPQLADVDGNIKTILKACLVTGYGEKQGAGWTMPFEDDYRMVLRRPLRTGSPPDLKIENGTIDIDGTPTPRHRIVSYDMDSCTGLDDPNELAAANILTRDRGHGQEWHLIVTDFAFMLCYQMGENDYQNYDKNRIWYVGQIMNWQDADLPVHLTNAQTTIQANGTGKPWMYALAYNGLQWLDLIAGNLTTKALTLLTLSITETQINNDYAAQHIIYDHLHQLPFYTSLSDQYDDLITSVVDIDTRPMLRFVDKPAQDYDPRAYYIPLDYWLL